MTEKSEPITFVIWVDCPETIKSRHMSLIKKSIVSFLVKKGFKKILFREVSAGHKDLKHIRGEKR